MAQQGIRLFGDEELKVGLAQARARYHEDLDAELLRELANSAREKWEPGKDLRAVAVAAVKERIRERSRAEQGRFGAYVGAIMKMCNARSVKKRQAAARSRLPPSPKPEPKPGPTDAKGQYLLAL